MKQELVIDASVAASWVIPDEKSEKSERLLKNTLEEKILLVEPVLWQYEILNLLKSAVSRKRLSESMAKKALHLFANVPVEFVSPDHHSPSHILHSSLQHNLSAYDAAYLALAELRGLPLITQDKDLLSLQPRFPWIKTL